MNNRGHEIKYLFMSGECCKCVSAAAMLMQALTTGGLVKNKLLMQLLADICQIPIQLPFSHSASVVLGSAMLGAIAASEAEKGPIQSQNEAASRGRDMSAELWRIMERMSRPGTTVLPKADEKEKRLLNVKYKIFHAMIAQQREFRQDVEAALN